MSWVLYKANTPQEGWANKRHMYNTEEPIIESEAQYWEEILIEMRTISKCQERIVDLIYQFRPDLKLPKIDMTYNP
jgi:hypothetical protein